MGADDDTTSSLILRLSALGFDAIHARRGSRVFVKVLEAADVILCVGAEHPAVGIAAAGRPPAPFILLVDALPEAAELVVAMREGVIDVLTASVDDETLGRRLRDGIARARPTDLRLAGQLDSLKRDQRAGRYVQMRMLPPSPLAIGDYRLSHRVQPSMILSGDCVDYFRICKRHFVFYIADVSGHGASSAFITVILRNFSRRLRNEYRGHMPCDPGEMLGALNRELMEQDLGKHATMFLGVVDMDANTLAYASAGHFPHALHSGGGGAATLEAAGKPVGLFEDVRFESHAVPLAPGDSIVAFSDGVLEVMHEEGLAAKEAKLTSCAAQASRAAPPIGALWDALGIVDGTTGPDDITCLVMERMA